MEAADPTPDAKGPRRNLTHELGDWHRDLSLGMGPRCGLRTDSNPLSHSPGAPGEHSLRQSSTDDRALWKSRRVTENLHHTVREREKKIQVQSHCRG